MIQQPRTNTEMTTSFTIKPNDHDFSAMHDRMQWYIDQEILPCCMSLVLNGLDVVDFSLFGYMDLDSRAPLREDAIYRMYSNTKIVTSVAALMLLERGTYSLDDPLEKHLPEFADMQVVKAGAGSITDTEPASCSMTPRHLLSHSAGLSYGWMEPKSVIDSAYAASGLNVPGNDDITIAELSERLGQLPLAYHPGSSWRYSFATDITGRLIEVLSGQTFDAFLQENIFEPLGMTDTGFFVPPEKQDRFITMYAGADLFDPMKPGLTKADDPATGIYSKPRRKLSGGGGLVSTVQDYLAFIRALINGGEWNGVRLLREETLQLMRSNQLANGVGVAFPMWSMPGTVFGLGVALRETPGDADSALAKDEYFWGGIAGTHSWIAPGANLAGMCFTQRMPAFWHPFSHDFRDHVYGSLA